MSSIATKKDIQRYKVNLREEQEAALLYEKMAASERKPEIAEIYTRLAQTEKRHADVWEGKLKDAGVTPPPFKQGFRTRVMAWIARRFGSSQVVGMISAIESKAAGTYENQPEAEIPQMEREEKSHARMFNYLSRTGGGLEGPEVARLEGRHRSGGNALRAGILGANDGLVSVFCLVMGVAGAGVGQRAILITGAAGLLSGALSMALGEWISVQSNREMFRNQLKIEKQELDEVPEEEKEELALIYQAKGLDKESAEALADRLLSDKSTALDTLAREELGIDPNELGGSAWVAAISSFLLFALGAIIPVLPYFFFHGTSGIVASAIFSGAGLFLLGAATSLMTGRNWAFAGGRMILFGLAAAAVTFGIGHLIGINL